jgi:sarcosine oxidase subunit gamma
MAEQPPDPGFAMTELTGWALTQLAFRPASFADLDAAFLRRTGRKLPANCGEVVGGDLIEAFRLSPRRLWFVGSPSALATALADGLAPQASVLSLTAGRRRYRLTGGRCTEVLAKGIALDLEGSGLPPGRAAETQLHRMPVLLHRRPDSFELLVPRSFAASFEAWVADAAMETGWRPAA